MKLYKYRALGEYTDKIFEEGKLYFAPPCEFNDPYEFVFIFDLDASTEEKKEFFYKNDPQFMEELGEFENKEEEDKYFSHLNTESFVHHTKSLTDLLRAQTGVLCMSDSPLNINMWGYYGDSHKGICLEYEFEEEEYLNTLKEVQYSDSIPTIQFFKEDVTNLKPMLEKFAYTKYRTWQNEKEYRLTTVLAGAKEFKRSSLKAIYFGVNFDFKSNKKFLDLVQSKFPKIDLYILSKDKNKFQIKFNDGMPIKFDKLIYSYIDL